MLQITILSQPGKPPQVFSGNMLLVADDNGCPCAVVQEVSAGVTLAATRKDPDFSSLLQKLGGSRIIVAGSKANDS